MRLPILLSILCVIFIFVTGCPAPPEQNAGPPDEEPGSVTEPEEIITPDEPVVEENIQSHVEQPLSSGQEAGVDGAVDDQTSGDEIPAEEVELDGWIRAWGESRVNITSGVAMDGAGNIYIVGTFARESDFDPSEDTVELEALGENDVFISKFDPDGELVWSKSFGGPENERVLDIEVDRSGNLYITGTFGRTADFDPDPDNIIPITAQGRTDCYLMSVNSDGEYRWAKNWGGDRGSVDVFDIALSGSSPIVTGWYSGSIDFDPEEEEAGQGLQGAIARSASDVYISYFSSSGRFDRIAAWGGDSQHDQMTTTCIEVDRGGNIILAGRFQGRFEAPGTTGLDVTINWHTSRGSEDAFLMKLDSRGYAQWARTWGGEFADYAHGVAVTPGGSIFVVGGIDGTADLCPLGHTEDLHEIETYGFTFLSKYSPRGVYQWGRSFGTALGMNIDSNSSGDAVITGVAKGFVDFDPDRDEDAVDEKSGSVFITSIDNSGDYLWSIAFGRTDYDMGTDIMIGPDGNIFATGMYRGSLVWDEDTGFIYSSTTSDANAFLLKLNPDGGW